MRHVGGCHCGNLQVAFESTRPASDLELRECGCTFGQISDRRTAAHTAADVPISAHSKDEEV